MITASLDPASDPAALIRSRQYQRLLLPAAVPEPAPETEPARPTSRSAERGAA